MKKATICTLALLYSLPLSAAEVLRLECKGSSMRWLSGREYITSNTNFFEIDLNKETAKWMGSDKTVSRDKRAVPAKITDHQISFERKSDKVINRYKIDRDSGRYEWSLTIPNMPHVSQFRGLCKSNLKAAKQT